MKPLPSVCRVSIAGALLAGLSLPALATTPSPAAPKAGDFGSGWVGGEVAPASEGTLPAPLPYGAGYEQRHSQRTTITWPWPSPATDPGRSAAGGGRSGQGGGNGGGGGGGGGSGRGR